MLDGLVGGLIVAWILTWFNFDNISIEALQELFNMNVSINTYYFVFAIIGMIGGLFSK